MIQRTIEVQGVRESLRTLGKIDKDLRKASVASIKAAGQPMVQVARLQYPQSPPLSGMANNGRLQYQPGRVRQQVSISVGGRAPKNSKQWPIVTLRQNNAAGALYSMAGMSNNAWSRASNAGQMQFSQLLEQRFGKAQRGMWKQVRLIRILAERNLMVAVKAVEVQTTRELKR